MSSYVLDDAAVVIGAEDQRYFERLEAAGLKLTLPQRRWWARNAETLGADMRREYPATPDEAFEQALEGAYFAYDLCAAAKQGRVGGFPYDQRSTVQTFWDLGRNDLRPAPPMTRRRALMHSSPSLAADTNLRRRKAASTARSNTGTTAGWCSARYHRMRPPTRGQTDGERTSDRSCRADGSRLGCRGNHLSKARLHLDAKIGAR